MPDSLIVWIYAVCAVILMVDKLFVDFVKRQTLKKEREYDPAQWKFFRWKFVLQYLFIAGICFFQGVFSAEEVFPPAVIATIIAYYIFFIRWRDPEVESQQ